MHIVHVTQALFPYVVGGSPIGTHLLANQEARTGNQVTVHTVDYGRPAAAVSVATDYSLQLHRRIWMPWDVIGTAGNPLAPSIRRAVSQSGGALVHLHSHLFFPSWFGMRGARNSNLPVVLTIHGVFAQRSHLVNAMQRAWIASVGKYLFKHSDLVVCQTLADGKRVEDLGVPKEKIRIVANACNEAAFYPPATEPVGPTVIWVGRHVPEKGIPVLLEAWKQVVKEAPGARLTLVGEGPGRAEAERLIGRGRLTESVTIMPHIEPQALGDLLRASRLFVLPSLQEGLPMSLIEAAASGRPIITTQGLSELGPIATYVPAGDAGALAEAIVNDLQTPAQASARGREARRAFEDRWSVAKLAERYQAVYREAIQIHSPAGAPS